MQTSQEPTPDESLPADPLKRLSRLFATVAALTIAVLLLFIIGAKLLAPKVVPELTDESFAKARALWDKNRFSSYEIEVTVSGRQPAEFRVLVQDGKAIGAWLDGRRVSQERVWGTWSVDGMFDTISRDLEMARNLETDRSAQFRLKLQTSFDADYGYPVCHIRTEVYSKAPNQEVRWSVVAVRDAVR